MQVFNPIPKRVLQISVSRFNLFRNVIDIYHTISLYLLIYSAVAVKVTGGICYRQMVYTKEYTHAIAAVLKLCSADPLKSVAYFKGSTKISCSM